MTMVLEWVPPVVAGTAPPPARPRLAAGPGWLWWLFLAGVAAFCSLGPTCAWH